MEKLKALMEKRNAKVDEMNAIANRAVEEVRAITSEEDERFKALESEVRALDGTIELVAASRIVVYQGHRRRIAGTLAR